MTTCSILCKHTTENYLFKLGIHCYLLFLITNTKHFEINVLITSTFTTEYFIEHALGINRLDNFNNN